MSPGSYSNQAGASWRWAHRARHCILLLLPQVIAMWSMRLSRTADFQNNLPQLFNSCPSFIHHDRFTCFHEVVCISPIYESVQITTNVPTSFSYSLTIPSQPVGSRRWKSLTEFSWNRLTPGAHGSFCSHAGSKSLPSHSPLSTAPHAHSRCMPHQNRHKPPHRVLNTIFHVLEPAWRSA